MRKILWCSIVIYALLFPVAGFAEAPQQIAGIRIGASIDQYRDILQMDTKLPVRHMEYLSEVELKATLRRLPKRLYLLWELR